MTKGKVIRSGKDEYVILGNAGAGFIYVCPVTNDSNNHRAKYFLSLCAASSSGIDPRHSVFCSPEKIRYPRSAEVLGYVPENAFNEICALAHCEIMSQRLEETPRIRPPSIYSW